MVVSGAVETVTEILERTGCSARLGHANLFPTQLQALDAVWQEAHAGSREVGCPLRVKVS